MCAPVGQNSLRIKLTLRHRSTRVDLVRTTKAERHVTDHFSATTRQRSRQIINEIRNDHHETMADSSYQRFLDSLKFPEMNARSNSLHVAHRRTFRWVFETSVVHQQRNLGEPREGYTEDKNSKIPNREIWDNFSDWLGSDRQVYWISGHPGSGKSTLLRFLNDFDRTKELLGSWRPGTLLLSHYFWKAGSRLQRGLKGLYCTMIHQFLLRKRAAAVSVLARLPVLMREKQYQDDWSIDELSILFGTLVEETRASTCIFIDGIDEADSEEQLSILSFVGSLATLPNVKVCVSSRPEPLLPQRLEQYPQLRVQDLTVQDIREYIEVQLQQAFRIGSKPKHPCRDLTSVVCRKAEGVFLWAVLAVQSLIRGIQLGDDDDVLFERLAALPRELEGLYLDMWRRQKDDIPSYRKLAARYFGLVIAAKKWQNIWRLNQPDDIDLAWLLGAIEERRRSTLYVHERNLTIVSEAACLTMRASVRSRCAGLLQVCQSDKLPNAKVDFIHRSAYAFLVESEAGQCILSHDDATTSELMLDISQGWWVQGDFNASQGHIYGALGPLCWVDATHPRAQEMNSFVPFPHDPVWSARSHRYHIGSLCYGLGVCGPEISEMQDSYSVIENHIVGLVQDHADRGGLATDALSTMLRDPDKLSLRFAQGLLACGAGQTEIPARYGPPRKLNAGSILNRLAFTLILAGYFRGTSPVYIHTAERGYLDGLYGHVSLLAGQALAQPGLADKVTQRWTSLLWVSELSEDHQRQFLVLGDYAWLKLCDYQIGSWKTKLLICSDLYILRLLRAKLAASSDSREPGPGDTGDAPLKADFRVVRCFPPDENGRETEEELRHRLHKEVMEYVCVPGIPDQALVIAGASHSESEGAGVVEWRWHLEGLGAEIAHH